MYSLLRGGRSLHRHARAVAPLFSTDASTSTDTDSALRVLHRCQELLGQYVEEGAERRALYKSTSRTTHYNM